MKPINYLFVLATIFLFLPSCGKEQNNKKQTIMNNDQKYDTATFGGGCYWCVEAIYSDLKGVIKVLPGFSGGTTKNPTYKEVCTGETGHAEVCQIIYDPSVTSFHQLLEVFWASHDPTSMNKQGEDVGTQYRSVIFYHNEEQKEQALASMKQLSLSGIYDKPVVTAIEPYAVFYEAENYHHDYYTNHKDQPYCSMVIKPKLDKIRKKFSSFLKEGVK
jgi:peptide-methionine (S)-S-oxide reductase